MLIVLFANSGLPRLQRYTGHEPYSGSYIIQCKYISMYYKWYIDWVAHCSCTKVIGSIPEDYLKGHKYTCFARNAKGTSVICMHWYGANIYQLEILSENDEVTSFCLLLLHNVFCGSGESHQAYKQINMVFMMKHWLTFPYQNVKTERGKKLGSFGAILQNF